VLQEVAREVSQVLRSDDVAARLGGDEFVLLLDRIAGPEQALRVAERLRLAVRGVVMADGHAVTTSMTIGVALSEPDVSGKELLARADRALYRAKELGRDRVALWARADRAAG
jgi:diguanylate cyclase (GGDEF)-like protein